MLNGWSCWWHATAVTGCCCNGVSYLLKVCSICSICSCRNGICSTCANLCTILCCPIYKAVTHAWCSYKSYWSTMLNGWVRRWHATAITSSRCNGVSIDCKVCFVSSCFCRCECVCSICAYLCFTLCPIYKAVTHAWCSYKSYSIALLNSWSFRRHATTVTCCCCNSVIYHLFENPSSGSV